MPSTPYFIDDPELQAALDSATAAARSALAPFLLDLPRHEAAFLAALRQAMAETLSGKASSSLPPLVLGPDAFGDRFELNTLPLARPGSGYAVQLLDTDQLLDRCDGVFRAVRDPALKGLFPDFDSAYQAAKQWWKKNGRSSEEHALAIVPAAFDAELARHVLIYGVLTRLP